MVLPDVYEGQRARQSWDVRNTAATRLLRGHGSIPSVTGVLELQRAAGNRAVVAMLEGRIPVQRQKCCTSCADGRGCDGGETEELTTAPEALSQAVQRKIGDGHDLSSPRFAADKALEACFDNEARLTKGMTGPPVTKVQQALMDLGHDLGPSCADGVYGTWTWNAVKQFKTDERLGFEHMGDVGPGSMGRLDQLFPPTDTPPVPPVPPSQPVGLVGSATCAGVIAGEEQGGDNVVGDSTDDVTGPVERQASGAVARGETCPVISDFSGFGRIPPTPDARAALMSLRLELAGGMIEVRVDRSKSWLNPYFVPTGNERVPDTARLVRECGQAFQGGEVAPGQAYGAWSKCSTNVSPLEAHSPPQCETVIGRELDPRRAVDRDTRLLRHEQYHVKLACALARIGNARIARGIPAARALADIHKEEARLQKLYDHETEHGCNLAAQATWQSAIDTPGGLI